MQYYYHVSLQELSYGFHSHVLLVQEIIFGSYLLFTIHLIIVIIVVESIISVGGFIKKNHL